MEKQSGKTYTLDELVGEVVVPKKKHLGRPNDTITYCGKSCEPLGVLIPRSAWLDPDRYCGACLAVREYLLRSQS